MSSPPITSRRELKESLQQRMVDSYENVKEEQELESDQTYLKSYLIEADRDEFTSDLVDRNIRVFNTDEEGFTVLKLHNSNGSGYYYLDKLDERFWSIHTLEKSNDSDSFVERLVFPRFTQLDFPWLSSGFLRRIGESPRNTFKSFSLSFKNKFENIEEDATDVSKLSMRLWGNSAKRVLGTLSQDQDLSKSTTLSNVGIRRSFDDGRVLIEDIKHNAKFTARGDAVDGHFHQLMEVKNDYKEVLSLIEDEYSIARGKNTTGGTVEGSPVIITFNQEIPDMEAFFNVLLSSSEPFRLWGVKNEVDSDYYRVSGVDMHTGHELDLEVCPTWMRIYLPEGSCGNVILRLFTNIQHYFDSRAELEGEEHGNII